MTFQQIPPATPACAAYAPLLSLVALGEHDERETLAHLAECAHCQAELDSYRALRATLRRELSPRTAFVPPLPWSAATPLTMEDIMNPDQPSPSRMPFLVSKPSRAENIWKGAIAAFLVLVVGLAAVLRFGPLATPHPAATAPAPTITPYPTVPALPVLTVQPSLHLDADQRLGGTMAGFARLCGVTLSSLPQASCEWKTTIGGKPIDVGAIPQDPRNAADGKAHFAMLEFTPPFDQQTLKPALADPTYPLADLEALVASFLPADAHLVGEKTGTDYNNVGGAVTGLAYTSASLAATFTPHPDKVFLKNGTFSGAAGSLFWYCQLRTYQNIQFDDCFLNAGELG